MRRKDTILLVRMNMYRTAHPKKNNPRKQKRAPLFHFFPAIVALKAAGIFFEWKLMIWKDFAATTQYEREIPPPPRPKKAQKANWAIYARREKKGLCFPEKGSFGRALRFEGGGHFLLFARRGLINCSKRASKQQLGTETEKRDKIQERGWR